MCMFVVFTARSINASAILGIVIRLSVSLSVRHTRALWRNERTYSWNFDSKRGWWAMSPSTWNLRLKWPTPFEKRQFRLISAYNVSTVRATEICSIIANRYKSTSAFQRVIDEVRTLPLTPPKDAQKANFSFLWIKFKFNRIKSVTKFLCVKTSSGKVVVEPFPYPTVYKCWR